MWTSLISQLWSIVRFIYSILAYLESRMDQRWPLHGFRKQFHCCTFLTVFRKLYDISFPSKNLSNTTTVLPGLPTSEKSKQCRPCAQGYASGPASLWWHVWRLCRASEQNVWWFCGLEEKDETPLLPETLFGENTGPRNNIWVVLECQRLLCQGYFRMVDGQSDWNKCWPSTPWFGSPFGSLWNCSDTCLHYRMKMGVSFVSHWFGPMRLVVPSLHTVGFWTALRGQGHARPILVWEHPMGFGFTGERDSDMDEISTTIW